MGEDIRDGCWVCSNNNFAMKIKIFEHYVYTFELVLAHIVNVLFPYKITCRDRLQNAIIEVVSAIRWMVYKGQDKK